MKTCPVRWDGLELFLPLQCSVLRGSSPALIAQDERKTCTSCGATPDGVFWWQKGSDLLGQSILAWPSSTAWRRLQLSNYLWCCWQCGVGAWCVVFLCGHMYWYGFVPYCTIQYPISLHETCNMLVWLDDEGGRSWKNIMMQKFQETDVRWLTSSGNEMGLISI